MKIVKRCMTCGSLFICNRLYITAHNECQTRVKCFCSNCNSVIASKCDVTIIKHSK